MGKKLKMICRNCKGNYGFKFHVTSRGTHSEMSESDVMITCIKCSEVYSLRQSSVKEKNDG